jgi:hypothetical protein
LRSPRGRSSIVAVVVAGLAAATAARLIPYKGCFPMDTLYYSLGSASIAPNAVLAECGAPDTLVRIDNFGKLAQALSKGPHLLGERFRPAEVCPHMLPCWPDPSMEVAARFRNVGRSGELAAERPAIKRVYQQNEAA